MSVLKKYFFPTIIWARSQMLLNDFVYQKKKIKCEPREYGVGKYCKYFCG